MSKTAEQRRDLLRRYIRDHNLKIATWSKAAGVSANSIYNFLNGHSEGLDPTTYRKLARQQQVPEWKLTGEEPEPPSPTSLWVVGHVEAGSYREAVEWDRSQWYAIDVPVPARFRRKAKALEVRGSSMNLEYAEGSIVIWVDVLDFREPRHEDHVVVYAHAVDDGVEATVKEFRVVDGKIWLWPRSSDPAHQAPIDPEQPADGIASIEVKGIVLGGYRPRIY